MARRISTVLCGLALATACSNDHYSHAVVTDVMGDAQAEIDLSSGIVVPEGAAVSANIVLVANDGDDLSATFVSLDTAILEVDGDPTNANTYVFLGISAGHTEVKVLANGQEVATVNAIVNAPPASSVVSLPPDAGTIGPDSGQGHPTVTPDGGASDAR
jgi:hypothetical protein